MAQFKPTWCIFHKSSEIIPVLHQRARVSAWRWQRVVLHYTLLFFNLLFLSMSCNGQESNENSLKSNSLEGDKDNFIIGDYLILPKSEEVRSYKMLGGVNWDGYTYEKDPKIDYKRTTLLVLENYILFKEYFPFDFNLDKLHIIYKDNFRVLSKDDKNIYNTSGSMQAIKINVSDYADVNDFVYKSKSEMLFFLDIGNLQLTPIGIDVDEKSVKHLAGNYYYDNNGLYFFGAHYRKSAKEPYPHFVDKSEKLISSQNTVPVVSKNYFSFNKQVFATHGNQVEELSVDAEKIIEINIGASGSFIADGKSIYSDSGYGYDDDEHNGKTYYGIWCPALYSDICLQKIYSPFLPFMKVKNSIIFNKSTADNSARLIAVINKENYLLSNKNKVKIDKILFYHSENGIVDIFDEKYLRIYADGRFIQYKNMLYFGGIPVETSKLDMENLKEIENSNYLTDGKSLFYIGSIHGYGNLKKNGVEYANFDDNILGNVFAKELKPINRDLLSDGICLISKAQKIKISDLNLSVKIIQ